MENLIKVKAVQDDDSHWYIIPNEEVDDFFGVLENIQQDYLDAEDYFEERFSKYRTGGGPNNIQLYADLS